jgi:hypothetical protein
MVVVIFIYKYIKKYFFKKIFLTLQYQDGPNYFNNF